MCLQFLRKLFRTKGDATTPLPRGEGPRPVAAPIAAASAKGPSSFSLATYASSLFSSNSSAVNVPRRPMPRRQPSISHQEMSRQDMYAALEAIRLALGNMPYAIIGGVACILLGSNRGTKDFDIVVPDGRAAEAATLLAAEGQFGTEMKANGRRRVWFNASPHRHYNVDVLEPHDINQVLTDDMPETVDAGGFRVLDPKQLLNFKIASWTDRMGTHGYKKINHARDIMFLVDYLGKKGVTLDRGEVYHATDDFMVMFFASYPGSMAAFEKVGLMRTGQRKTRPEDRVYKSYEEMMW